MAEKNAQSREILELVVVEGIYLLALHSSWEDKIRQLRQMKLRDDDVFISTYPRSGTHWLWEMITMLRKGQPEHDTNDMLQCMMDIVHDDKLREMPSPRTLATHLPVYLLPVAEIKAKRTKMVYVYRNPKDACVSFFTLLKSSTWEFVINSDEFEQFFDFYFFSGKQPNGSSFKHLRQVYEFQQQNPEVPILILSYEDTRKDPVGCVKKLAQFLCLTASDELCSQIAQACSFDNMKKQEAEKATPDFGDDVMFETLKLDQHNIFYRKGQIGDWKNYFTVAMNERVDDLIKQEMKDLPFTFTFE